MFSLKSLRITMLLLMYSGAALPKIEGLVTKGITDPRPWKRSATSWNHWNHAKSRSAPLSMTMPLDEYAVVVYTWKSTLLESSGLDFPSTVCSALKVGTFTSALDIVSDPLVAAEVFSDAAHLVMDFAIFFGPATVVVRLAAVIGRVLTIASDYIPDHAMFPEELLFQVCMLLLSLTLLVKSLLPLAMSSSTNLSFQDRRTYCLLFGPAGVNWYQYKTLATMALEWITIQPEHAIEINSTSIYWLYNGDIAVFDSNGKVVNRLRRIKPPRSPLNATSCLVGEAKFIQTLEAAKFKHHLEVDDPSILTMTIKAGPSGAKLLRIDTNKLATLMEHDEHLAKAIRRLLVKSMHDKLCSLFNG